MTFDANAIFEEELTRRQLSFRRTDKNIYVLSNRGLNITANLENIRRNAERDGDAEAIRRFVDHILDTMPAVESRRRAWPEASKFLLFSPEPSDYDFGDTVHFEVSPQVHRVLTVTDEDWTTVSWVTNEMCAAWGVSVETACAVAIENQSALLDGVEIEVSKHGENKLGIVPVEEPYKASVIFAPSFKQLVQPEFGWPVLVVIPCRDFLYVLQNDSPLLNRLGGVVQREYRESGYPISTEVFRISDDGVTAIGAFPG